jgi:hypothetical protein
MNEVGFWRLRGISDRELEVSLRRLLGAGARVEARVVAHLAEVEARRLHLASRSSLFEYCLKDLGLSEYEAFVRIATARVATKYPIVFGMLERRELCLTAVVEVKGFLTEANHVELLREIAGKTKLQIREVLARRFPEADVAASVRKLVTGNRAHHALAPLAEERYRLQLAISEEVKRKLEAAQELLSHANAEGDLAVVLERALDALIGQLRGRRFGARAQRKLPSLGRGANQRAVLELPPADADANEKANVSAGRRRAHISAMVRRQVAVRDGERCAFVGEDGHRCECRRFLELHHKLAWGLGGPDTVDNLQLLCRAHNRLLAERDFGRAQIESAIERKRTG